MEPPWTETRIKERVKKDEYEKRVMELKMGFRNVPLSKFTVGDLLRIMDLYNGHRAVPLCEDDLKRLEDILLKLVEKKRKNK